MPGWNIQRVLPGKISKGSGNRLELFINNDQETPAPEVEQVIRQALATAAAMLPAFSASAQISVTLVDNASIRRLNRDYRAKDEATDVLSFPQLVFAAEEDSEEAFWAAAAEEPELLGDIVISLERAAEQAAAFGHSLAREVGYLAVHGLLHLLGWDHQTEADREAMRIQEELIMEASGLRRGGTEESGDGD